MKNGSGNSNRKDDNDNNNRETIETVLRELVQHHRLPYRFEGGVEIPFEADYRIIVVTTQAQELPCTLSVSTGTISSTTTTMTTTAIPRGSELRKILVRGRMGSHADFSRGDDLKFSSTLLERAQRDFLDRRRQRYESSASSPLPGEDDFHRWLSLSRIQAKNRRSRGGLPDAMLVEDRPVSSYSFEDMYVTRTTATRLCIKSLWYV